MIWPILSLIVLALSAATIVALLARKATQVRMIDVESIPTERTRRLKEQIILQKFERVSAEKLGTVSKAARQGVSAASKIGRRAVQKLYAMEQYYQKLKHSPPEGGHAVDPETIKRMLEEADALMREGETIPAEKRYIEIISHNPKHVKAYEGLGNLYLENKQYAQARETLLFTRRLSPDDISVHISLAEVEQGDGNPKKAVEYLRKVVELRSTNPKFLDRYIEASLEARLPEDARKGIAILKESNPENHKIADFEERAAALDTHSSQPPEPLV